MILLMLFLFIVIYLTLLFECLLSCLWFVFGLVVYLVVVSVCLVWFECWLLWIYYFGCIERGWFGLCLVVCCFALRWMFVWIADFVSCLVWSLVVCGSGVFWYLLVATACFWCTVFCLLPFDDCFVFWFSLFTWVWVFGYCCMFGLGCVVVILLFGYFCCLFICFD